MIRNLQQLSRPQRQLIFVLVFGGILLGIVGLTVLLIGSSLNTARQEAVALVDGVSVRQLAALPEDDAYPSSVAAYDGGVYTGSYASGAVWQITDEGAVTVLVGTRDAIGAVSGLAAAPDGALYVVDQRDTDTRSGGGDLKRILADGSIEVVADLADEGGFTTPDDVTLDGEGRVYVSDRGRNEVWRFQPDGSEATLFWSPPPAEGDAVQAAITGLAYDPPADAIVVTEPERNTIYRVPVSGGEAEIVYQHPAGDQFPPGFDGATVTPDGVLYVAALGQNGIVRVQDGAITYVAGQFRGSSDVDSFDGRRLYVANWDQSALALPLVQPRLPFGIDVIELGAE